LRGRDIKRFSYNFADLYLINTHNGVEQNGIPPVNIDDYPAVKKHLDVYYSKLKEREDKGITPYNLRSCAYMEEFNKQKIIYSEIVQSPQFFLDERGEFFVEATSFLITGEHLDYLVDWLNSSIIAWVFKQFYAGGGLGKKGFRYKKKFLEQLPIPKPRNDMKYENTNDLIKAYLDLTDEETNFISSSVNL